MFLQIFGQEICILTFFLCQERNHKKQVFRIKLLSDVVNEVTHHITSSDLGYIMPHSSRNCSQRLNKQY